MAATPPSGNVDLELARRVLRIEADAVRALVDRIDEGLAIAVEVLAACRGRVIVTGMGKSGIIAQKIAATLSSTGTPSHFLHPAEAAHGDLGVLQRDDVLVALSHSGETPELVRLIEIVKRIGAGLIALTGAPESQLGQLADVTLDCHVDLEACPMNLAPTASTTAALALGDALAMTLLVRKGFREEDFAQLHPGGQLGKQLIRVERLMHTGDEVPVVRVEAPMPEILKVIGRCAFGMTCVVDPGGRLTGIITDGDLRRHLGSARNPSDATAGDLMTAEPSTIPATLLAAEALNRMEARRITSLIVVDAERRVAGLVHLHDLWRTELF
jgi:arabinose-5-phosphate isomerase